MDGVNCKGFGQQRDDGGGSATMRGTLEGMENPGAYVDE